METMTIQRLPKNIYQIIAQLRRDGNYDLNEQLLRNSKFLFSVCGINLDRLSAISQQEKEKEPFPDMFPTRLLIK